MRAQPELLVPRDEGRPHPGRLLVYVAVAVVASLLVMLPGWGASTSTPNAQNIDTALVTLPPMLPTRVPPPPTESAAPILAAPAPASVPAAPVPAPALGGSSIVDPPLDPPLLGNFSWPEPAALPTPSPVVAPTTGAYLGAYHDPVGENGQASLFQILDNLPAFNEQIGRKLAIVHVYQPWETGWVLNEALASLADSEGAVPMISWRCGDANDRVAAGVADAVIFDFARQLREYARPVLLRWFWEMNLVRSNQCMGDGTLEQQAANYRAAFQRITAIFNVVGATNVAFVWAPSTAVVAEPMDPFYPGDEDVDWIGADGYSRRGLGLTAFAQQFTPWYELYASKGKPMMIAETGATDDLVEYLRGIAEVVPRDFPQIKALVYFDAQGGTDWRLASRGDAGIEAFAELGRHPYFALMPPDP